MLDCGICGRDWIVETGADVVEVCELQYSKVPLVSHSHVYQLEVLTVSMCGSSPSFSKVHSDCYLLSAVHRISRRLPGGALPGHVQPGALGAGGAGGLSGAVRGGPGGHHHRQRADGDHQAVSRQAAGMQCSSTGMPAHHPDLDGPLSLCEC